MNNTVLDINAMSIAEIDTLISKLNSAKHDLVNSQLEKRRLEAVSKLEEIKTNLDNLFNSAKTICQENELYFQYEIGDVTVSFEDGDWMSSTW